MLNFSESYLLHYASSLGFVAAVLDRKYYNLCLFIDLKKRVVNKLKFSLVFTNSKERREITAKISFYI